MPKTKALKLSTSKSCDFLNFKPAYLSIGKQNLVIFHFKNPDTNKMRRFRITIPKQKNEHEIRKLGNKMANEINQMLYAGWNPFKEDIKTQIKENKSITITNAIAKFLKHFKQSLDLDIIRYDTYRSYTSFIRVFEVYLEKTNKQNLNIKNITKGFFIRYSDYLLYQRGQSARTRNNHVAFWVTFFNFFIDRDYISQNPVIRIKKIREQKKRRKILPPDIKDKVNLLKNENPRYYTLCMMTYYCFIRRTELTKLKIKDLHLPYFITIRHDVSKNRKENNVTVPKILNELLQNHIKNADLEDYVFSANNYKPGSKQLAPKKISDEWAKFRKKYKIPNEYQFYSLKDTGITDLLKKGIPAIKVRDQARHYDLRITESYAHRNDSFDSTIKDMDFTF